MPAVVGTSVRLSASWPGAGREREMTTGDLLGDPPVSRRGTCINAWDSHLRAKRGRSSTARATGKALAPQRSTPESKRKALGRDVQRANPRKAVRSRRSTHKSGEMPLCGCHSRARPRPALSFRARPGPRATRRPSPPKLKPDDLQVTHKVLVGNAILTMCDLVSEPVVRQCKRGKGGDDE